MMVMRLFEECFMDVTGGNIKIKQADYLDKGTIPIIDQGKALIGGYTNDQSAIVKCKLPCIIFGDHSRNIKYYDEPFAIGADGVKLLRAKELIYPKFGYYYLQTVQLPETGYGSNFKYLKNISIPVPDLETQHKIVAILDKTNSLIEKRETTIAKYHQLLRALFLEMFGEPGDRHHRWEIDNIGKYAHAIVAGSRYSGEEKDELADDELGVLKTSAVTKGIFNPKEFKAVKMVMLKKNPVYLQKGDLLFSRVNTKELVGATCIVDKDYDRLFLPDKLWKVNTDESRLKKTYLYFVLQSKSMRDGFINIATGSSGSVLNISTDRFKTIPIPIPPIQLQEKFEVLYYKCMAHIDNLTSSQHQLAMLQKALSQQLFFGKSQFDIDLEIEALLHSFNLEDAQFKNKRLIVSAFHSITKDQTYFQRILDKLDEQEYVESGLYNKAKGIVFRALSKNTNRLQQVFVERNGTKRLKLTVNEVIEA